MIEVPILILGHSFLKMLGCLIRASNKNNIKPVLFIASTRPGKEYDNMDESIFKELTKGLSNYKVAIYNPNNIPALIKEVKKYNCIVGQDLYYHGKIFNSETIKKISISAYFDTLHHAVANKNRMTYSDLMFFPDNHFKDKFGELTNYTGVSCDIGVPVTDCYKMLEPEDKNIVTFFCPDQGFITNNTNEKIEKCLLALHENKFNIVVKERKNKPWYFKNKKLSSAVTIVKGDNKEYFPYESLKLINKSIFCIGGYTTAAVECHNLEIPYYNIELDKQQSFSQSIHCMKNKYSWAKEKYFSNNLFDHIEHLKQMKYTQPEQNKKHFLNSSVSNLIWEKIIEFL